MARMHRKDCSECWEFVWCRLLADATIQQVYLLVISVYIQTTYISQLVLFC